MTKTETTAKTTTKKTPEQALAALQAKQTALNEKANKLRKAIEEKKNAATRAQRVRIGDLAAEAGILELADDVLAVAFAAISAQHAPKAEPAPTV